MSRKGRQRLGRTQDALHRMLTKQAQADADKLAKFEADKAAALKEAEQFEAAGAGKSSNGIEKEVEAG